MCEETYFFSLPAFNSASENVITFSVSAVLLNVITQNTVHILYTCCQYMNRSLNTQHQCGTCTLIWKIAFMLWLFTSIKNYTLQSEQRQN